MDRLHLKGAKASMLKRALYASAACICFMAPASAQTYGGTPLKMKNDYIGYSAGVSFRTGYTDNVNLETGALKEDEFFLSSALSGGAIVSTPRVTAIALADIDFSYLTDQGDFVINQDMGGTSTFTLQENLLYLDASAQSSRQLVGDTARFSGNITSGRNQRADVHSITGSPYLYRVMADLSSVELRYRASQVFIDDSGTQSNLFGSNYLNDSTTQEVVAVYNSGSAIDRLNVRLTAYGNRTDEDGSGIAPDFEYEQGSVVGEVQAAVGRNFFLSGAVGYDEVETKATAATFFNNDALSGVFWRAGFTARPSPDSNVRFEYGERYDGDFIDAQVSHKLSPYWSLSASASRVFQSRAQTVSAQSRASQTATLDFADRLREGQELSAASLISSANNFARVSRGQNVQTVGLAVRDQARATLSGRYARTNVVLSANYGESDFGFRNIETYGAGLLVRRNLSRRLTGHARVNYRRSDTTIDTTICEANPVLFGVDPLDPVAGCVTAFGQTGETSTLIGSLGGSYRLYENVSVFADVSHTERFSPVATLEYGENAVTMGITLDF